MIMKIARALHKRTKGDKGFTLIELIVVIAVLGVLATLIIPKVVGVQDRAKTKAMDANEKIIKNALERYYLEHDETYPDELEELEGGYLDEIPGSFKYTPKNNGKDYDLTPNNTEQGDDDEQNGGNSEKN